MGVPQAIGQIGAAGIDAASAAATNIANNVNNKRTNETNLRIAQDTNATNIGIHQSDNDFNAAEAEKARQFQVEQWQRENEYNSPEALVQRYRQAGLNPAVMMEGQNSIASSAPSTSSASASPAPSLVSPRMEPFRAETYQPAQAFANLFQTLSAGHKNMSESNKTDTENQQLKEMFDDTLRGIKADNLRKQIENDFLPFVQNGQLEKNAMEVFALWNKANTDAALGRVADSEAALNKARELTEKWRTKEQKVIAETAHERIQSEINESRSRANANNASAAASTAAARLTDSERQTHEELRTWIVNEQKYKSRIAENNWKSSDLDLHVQANSLSSHLQEAKNAGLISEVQLKQLKEQLRRAEVDNDWRLYFETLDLIERINNGITNWIPLAPDKTTHQDIRQYDYDDKGRVKTTWDNHTTVHSRR